MTEQQPDLFGPCATSLAIRAAVREGKAEAAKRCDCKTPCWWRNGSSTRR